MPDVEFRVVHMDHNQNTISVHPQLADNSLRWSYKATDIGDIQYDLALSDPALIAAGADSFAPYKTDWRLGMNVNGIGWNTIHAGFHTNVNLRPRSGIVSVTGKDWTHWLEQPVWFDFYKFDFTKPGLKGLVKDFMKGADNAGFNLNGFFSNDAVYAWAGPKGATQQSVINDLIFLSFNRDLNAGGAFTDTDYVVITPSFSGASMGSIMSYVIQVQDETTYLDHIKSIAALSEPYGYDFTMNWNKTMEFFGPRLKLSASPDPIWTLDTTNVVADTVPDFDWTNNGPIATYIIGVGPASPAVWKLKKDQDSIDAYRMWLNIPRVVDTFTTSHPINQIKHATLGLQYIFPHKDLKITTIPHKMSAVSPGEGFLNWVGNTVKFKWDIPPYHTIDAYFWITGQDFHTDAAGNWLCDLSLEQIYDT